MTSIFKSLRLWSVVALGAVLMGASKSDPFETSKQLEIFTAVLREVQTQYVEEVRPERAVGSAIKGMLKELDPYTVYYSEDEIEDVRLLQTGAYGGVGCTIQAVDGRVLISDVFEGGPAFAAGLKVGDAFVKVGNVDVRGKTTSEISSLLKGEPGTAVGLTLEREGASSPMVWELTRANIERDPVPFYGVRADGIGYIALNSFTEVAGARVREAVEDLSKQGVQGVVLDLRGNGGGLLREAVKIVSLFASERDTVVYTRGRDGKIGDVYRTMGKPLMPEVPLAVLIDERSASASEIVAGALQDFDRAVILGETSFGKGLVQQIHPLPFGAQMKVTVAKYYTPSGRCIQEVNYQRDAEGRRVETTERKTFTTRGGREVRDAGGIDPDSTLNYENYPEVLMALRSKGLDLLFAARASAFLSEGTSPVAFEVSEELYAQFQAFLDEKAFTYESISEIELEKLKDGTAYFDFLEPDDVDELIALVQQRKGDVLKSDAEDIKNYLAEYLVSKHFAERGSVERTMVRDPWVGHAATILLDPQTTRQLLGVK